jgi:uncharacterized protein (DUF1697 family)
MVALLRAVNVGGTGLLPMADLRRIATDLGYGDVATYIQSGNLVLSSDEPATKVASDLAEAIAAETSARPDVIVRTHRQLKALAGRNPFLTRGEDPAKLHVLFTAGPAAPALSKLDRAAFAPDEAATSGSEVFFFLPGGVGRSKLAARLGRQQAAVGTLRGWKTVVELLALAAQAEG